MRANLILMFFLFRRKLFKTLYITKNLKFILPYFRKDLKVTINPPPSSFSKPPLQTTKSYLIPACNKGNTYIRETLNNKLVKCKLLEVQQKMTKKWQKACI